MSTSQILSPITPPRNPQKSTPQFNFDCFAFFPFHASQHIHTMSRQHIKKNVINSSPLNLIIFSNNYYPPPTPLLHLVLACSTLNKANYNQHKNLFLLSDRIVFILIAMRSSFSPFSITRCPSVNVFFIFSSFFAYLYLYTSYIVLYCTATFLFYHWSIFLNLLTSLFSSPSLFFYLLEKSRHVCITAQTFLRYHVSVHIVSLCFSYINPHYHIHSQYLTIFFSLSHLPHLTSTLFC